MSKIDKILGFIEKPMTRVAIHLLVLIVNSCTVYRILLRAHEEPQYLWFYALLASVAIFIYVKRVQYDFLYFLRLFKNRLNK